MRYDPATHVPSFLAGHAADGNVEWDGLRHDSRDDLYRTPGGAVPAGTPVTLRFRTFHDDATGVKIRFYSVDKAGQEIVEMTRAAAGVSCYQADLAAETCDFWEVTLPADWGADNLWYRFVVSDGADIDYYNDDTPALDGGLGAPTDDPVDQSWALMLHVPGFSSPSWAKTAVVYQVFPDRFRNGKTANDPKTGDVRYDDPVLEARLGREAGGLLPQLRRRRRQLPVAVRGQPARHQPGQGAASRPGLHRRRPRGRDREARLPQGARGSPRSTSTRSSTRGRTTRTTPRTTRRSIRISARRPTGTPSSPAPRRRGYGSSSTASSITSRATARSSTATATTRPSARANRQPPSTVTGSPSATWPAAPAPVRAAPNTMTYDGWFGFDSIPVINKANPAVQAYFLTGKSAIAPMWLKAGAAGWRLDVSGDASFPAGYWETFRQVTRAPPPRACRSARRGRRTRRSSG